MLVQSAGAHASKSYCAISWKRYVHVKHRIRIYIDDLIHLVLHFVKQAEWKSILTRVFFLIIITRCSILPTGSTLMIMISIDLIRCVLVFFWTTILDWIALEI